MTNHLTVLLFLLTLFFISMSSLNGQLYITPDSIYQEIEGGEVDINFEFTVKNETDFVRNIKVTRQQICAPEAWVSYFCDVNICYAPPTSERSYTIEAQDSLELFFFIILNNDFNHGLYEFVVTDDDDPEFSTLTRIYANAIGCLTNTSPSNNREVLLNVFPNPVYDILHAQHSEFIHHFQISNNLGQVMAEYNANATLDISRLENGVYFLQGLDENFMPLKTVRFIKK